MCVLQAWNRKRNFCVRMYENCTKVTLIVGTSSQVTYDFEQYHQTNIYDALQCY